MYFSLCSSRTCRHSSSFSLAARLAATACWNTRSSSSSWWRRRSASSRKLCSAMAAATASTSATKSSGPTTAAAELLGLLDRDELDLLWLLRPLPLHGEKAPAGRGGAPGIGRSRRGGQPAAEDGVRPCRRSYSSVSRARKLGGGERPRLIHFLAPSDRMRRSRSGSLPPPDLLPKPRPELHMRPHMAAGGGRGSPAARNVRRGVGNCGARRRRGDRVSTRKRVANP
ncbi:hypothetical protein ACQJBY_048426 [Aegilops geniculata]